MPIIRTYGCPECNHIMEVTLASEQWDAPPPDCPRCAAYDLQEPMRQEFKPVAIGGSNVGRAHAIAEDIVNQDYHAADIVREHRPQGTPTVRYKEPTNSSQWGIAHDTLMNAVTEGRRNRLAHGSGLDVLQSNLKSGVEPDLIAQSKKRMIRVW